MPRPKYLSGVSDKEYKEAVKYTEDVYAGKLVGPPNLVKMSKMMEIIHKEEVKRLFLMYDHPEEYKEWAARWKNEVNSNYKNITNNTAKNNTAKNNTARTARTGSKKTLRRREQRKRAANRKIVEDVMLGMNDDAY
jgi:CRISPR/Cas system CSM-associated protein Csm4 (group 5 of RAMP superfamily)